MVSTRLQCNSNNSNSGDGLPFPGEPGANPLPNIKFSSSSSSSGCMTRSGAPTMVSTRHQNIVNASCSNVPDSCSPPPSGPDLETKLSNSYSAWKKFGANSCSANPTSSCHLREPISKVIEAGQQHPRDSQHSAAPFNLLDLPTELIEQIISYCGYESASNLRLVCRDMNQISGSLLNRIFNKLLNQMSSRVNNIKAQMPRRESARRAHPLSCEFDIFETVSMRLNLLQMTLGKHIERKFIVFFPGGVLDEVYRILDFVRVTPKLPRPYRVTDELFDLTSMAMEHFKEKLEPKLPIAIHQFGTDSEVTSERHYLTLNNFDDIDDDPPQSNIVLRKRIRKINQGMKLYNTQLTSMKREIKGQKGKIRDLQKTLLEYASRLEENENKNEEMSRKYSTMLQELNKCKTELQYWRSKSPITPVCGVCGTPSASVPLEDLEALSNQGIDIPMLVVRPNAAEQEDVVAGAGLKQDGEISKDGGGGGGEGEAKCEHDSRGGDHGGASSSSSPPAVVAQNSDQNNITHPADNNSISSSNNNNNNSSSSSSSNCSLVVPYESGCCSFDESKGRPLRPAKRKAVATDKSTPYKRPRSILKLRSKVIKK